MYFKRNYSYDKIHFFNFNANFLQVICFFIFAFGNHTSVLTVISEINLKTPHRIEMLISHTKNIELLVYFLTMIIGYFSTLDDTPDIYIDREDQSGFMVFGKLFFMIFLTICVGLCYYLNKSTFEWLFNKDEEFTNKQNLIYSSGILLLLTVIGLEFTKVTAILSLLGGTGQIYLMFILPVAMYNKAFNPDTLTRMTNLVITWIFTMIGVFNTIVIVVDSIRTILKYYI
jgi:amino acid permease